MHLNETTYEEYGELYVGAQYLWNSFFDYAAYASALVWMGLFGYSQIKGSFAKFLERRRGAKNGQRAKVTEQYPDQLNVLQRSYDEVPFWWFLALFLVSLVIMVAILASNQLFIPVWTYFVAIATGALVVIPLGYLFALSNFQLVNLPAFLHISDIKLTSLVAHRYCQRALVRPHGQRHPRKQEPLWCFHVRGYSRRCLV